MSAREFDCGEHSSDWLLTIMAGALILGLHLTVLAAQTFGLNIQPVDARLRLGLVLLSAVALAVLLSGRRSASSALCAAAFATMTLPFLVTFWVLESNNAAAGRLGTAFDLFLGPKLIMFVVAALCPSQPRWLAPSLLATFCIEALVLWFALDLGSGTAKVSPQEPTITIFCAIIAWVLLCFRLHHTRREHELARTRAEAVMLRTTNDAFLAVRDMANTPLQNLEVALSLMSEGRPSDPLVAIGRRAVGRLRELSHVLPVDDVTSASVDARSLERIRTIRDGLRADLHLGERAR